MPAYMELDQLMQILSWTFDWLWG